MRIKRRIEIVRSSERIIFRRNYQPPEAWCPGCAAMAPMVAPEAAAAAARVAARKLYRWVESGLVHFAEGRGGELYICLDSALTLSERPSRDE